MAQPDEFSLILTFAPNSKHSGPSHHVLVCCQPGFARLSVIEERPEAPATVRAFIQYLRSRLMRAKFRGIDVAADDRQATILLETREGKFELLLSILGARSNIYLLDSDGKLLYFMRPLEMTRRDLVAGEAWVNPNLSPRLQGTDRWEKETDENYFRAVEETYSTLVHEKQFNELARRISGAFKREASLLERKLNNLQSDLGTGGEPLRYWRMGELLKGVMHTIRPGDCAVTAVDYETGEELSIPLDSRLSASENLELYFQRYQKESRREAELNRQIQRVGTEIAAVAQFRREFESVVNREKTEIEPVQSFAARPGVKKLLDRYSPAPSRPVSREKRSGGQRKLPGRLLPKRYRSADGLEIWVGRNDEGNDFLTTKLAHGRDLFFHLEGSPGSHVVLRTEGRNDPPAESILDACELAVQFSRLSKMNRADVHVAAIKDIKKPRGAKPGLVYVLRGKTIHLRRDPKRLERILASRFEPIDD